jgi:homoserine O-acetyltransferase
VENYLKYNGYKFTERFDANSYLYILKAMDIFDLSYGYGSYEDALKRLKANTLLIDFTTDFLFPAYQMDEMYDIMKKYDNKVERVTIDSDYGHDAFLLEFDDLSAVTLSFLEKARRKKYV